LKNCQNHYKIVQGYYSAKLGWGVEVKKYGTWSNSSQPLGLKKTPHRTVLGGIRNNSHKQILSSQRPGGPRGNSDKEGRAARELRGEAYGVSKKNLHYRKKKEAVKLNGSCRK